MSGTVSERATRVAPFESVIATTNSASAAVGGVCAQAELPARHMPQLRTSARNLLN
jgi:hypothetical protein